MPIPNRYQSTNEQALATYDFFEFSSTIGYKSFYAAVASGAYFLTTETNIYSAPNSYIGGIANTAVDEDFDFEFQRSTTVEGDIIANIQATLDNQSGTQATTSTITANIYHYDGITETLLGTASLFFDAGSLVAGANEERVITFKISVTETIFTAGDKLRLNLQATNPSTSRRVFILCDPANRTAVPYGAGDPVTFANSKIIVPFKIVQ